MKRIAFVIPTLAVGGSERQLIALASGLAKDHEVTIFCTRQEGTLASEARKCGVRVEALGLGSPWSPRMTLKLREKFRHHRPDIVHSIMFGFDYWVNRAARATGVPVVVSSRRQLASWKRRRHIWLQRRANTLVDAVVCNSEAIRRFAIEQEGIEPALLRVIPNGIDAEAYQPRLDRMALCKRYGIPDDRRIVGIVANFSPVKDHELFLRAAALLARERENLHFLMAGSGPTRSQAESIAAELGIAARVTRVASATEVRDLLSLMEVSVLTSKVEGFPNAIMESMAAGVPVVGAAVGGIPELMGDNERGVLVHTRAPADFARAIGELLDDPARAQTLAAAASEWVRRELTVDKLVKAHRKLYADLLAHGARRSG